MESTIGFMYLGDKRIHSDNGKKKNTYFHHRVNTIYRIGKKIYIIVRKKKPFSRITGYIMEKSARRLRRTNNNTF